MIKANEAKAQSVENKQLNALKDIEESIKKAIKKGKTSIMYTCQSDLVDYLRCKVSNFGYKVNPMQGGIKVTWG